MIYILAEHIHSRSNVRTVFLSATICICRFVRMYLLLLLTCIHLIYDWFINHCSSRVHNSSSVIIKWYVSSNTKSNSNIGSKLSCLPVIIWHNNTYQTYKVALCCHIYIHCKHFMTITTLVLIEILQYYLFQLDFIIFIKFQYMCLCRKAIPVGSCFSYERFMIYVFIQIFHLEVTPTWCMRSSTYTEGINLWQPLSYLCNM